MDTVWRRFWPKNGLGFIALTFWKSATAEMRDYGVDAAPDNRRLAVVVVPSPN